MEKPESLDRRFLDRSFQALSYPAYERGSAAQIVNTSDPVHETQEAGSKIERHHMWYLHHTSRSARVMVRSSVCVYTKKSIPLIKIIPKSLSQLLIVFFSKI